MQFDHLPGDQKMDDLRSIHRDQTLLRHAIRQIVQLKVCLKMDDLKMDDLKMDDLKMDDLNLVCLNLGALKIRHVKMKVGMNYYGHY
jgi:hypothetical protein